MVTWQLPQQFYQPEQLDETAKSKLIVGEDKNRNTVIFQRYCHVYAKGEVEQLFQSVSNVEIVESYFDSSNWCCRVRKTTE